MSRVGYNGKCTVSEFISTTKVPGTLFFCHSHCHSHSHNDIGNVFLPFLSNATR